VIVERLRLDGRCVVVAGAGGGGIGTFTARAAAEAGARVVGAEIDEKRLDELQRELRAHGLDITPVCADLRTDDGIARVVSTALEAHGAIHGLVNVVGGSLVRHWAPALEFSRAQWNDVLEFNLAYVMFLSQAVARTMVERSIPGSIVNLSSVSGVAVAPYHVGYGTAKAGVIALTRTLAVEWGRHSIRVNTIAPGTINTPRSEPQPPDEREPRAIPLGRRGEPAEVASAVLFLLSDLASYVSGQCLTVDGAMSCKGAYVGDDNEPIFVNSPEIRARMKPRR
jgi:NAD(P)-dependent dehydrogenase (short-subunit alcohol dehydrogenase family)